MVPTVACPALLPLRQWTTNLNTSAALAVLFDLARAAASLAAGLERGDQRIDEDRRSARALAVGLGRNSAVCLPGRQAGQP